MSSVTPTINISPPDVGYIEIPWDQSTRSTNRHISITLEGRSYLNSDDICWIFSVEWTCNNNNIKPIIFNFYGMMLSEETLKTIYTQGIYDFAAGVWKQGRYIGTATSAVKHDKCSLYYPKVPPSLSVSAPSSNTYTDIPDLIMLHSITRCPQQPKNPDKIYMLTINIEHLTQSCSGVKFFLRIPKSEVIYEPLTEMKKEEQPTPGPSVEKGERSITTTQDTEDIDPSSVIDGWPMPVTLTQPTLISKVKLFIASSIMNDTKIVLITSGGTKVALEKRNIRYVVNFSTGKRGAASAEYFLRQGYYVIYLGSVDSQKPFSRKFKIHTLLDILDTSGQVKENYRQQMSELITDYESLKNKLLMFEFDTLPEYFLMLKNVSRMLLLAGSNVMIYLSAAVSDFYKHYSDLPDHKIASGSSLQLDLKPVPNVISQLVEDWCPGAFVVTFKLESDPDILMNKARASLNKYKQNVVVCNLLETRCNEVHLLMSSDDDKPVEEKITVTEDDNIEIESLIVDKLILKHKDYSHDNA